MQHAPNIIVRNLPTADMLYINHPQHGLVLCVDPRVPDTDLDTMLNIITTRLELWPERVPACLRIA